MSEFPTPVSLLRALAKAERRPVRSVNIYDYDVCGEFDWEELFEGAQPPEDRLRCELRLPVAGRRFALRANDRYFAINIAGDFAAGLFSINRPSNSMTIFHGEMRTSAPVGDYPVFVSVNDSDPPALQLTRVREAICSLRLEPEESLKVYRNGIDAYLLPRTQQSLIEILGLLATLANELPAVESNPLTMSDLPDRFRPLIPLIRKWGISDDADRGARMERLSHRQLEALVRRVSPFFQSINEYLDSFGQNVPASAAALGSLAEAANEAKLTLQANSGS